MSYTPKMRLPHPESWSAFEDLCWGLWKEIWGDAATKKHGRNGQPQKGVDIYGQPTGGRAWAGVQCKGKDSYAYQELTEGEIRDEVKKAEGFIPHLTKYTIATTASRDCVLQEFVRTFSDENVNNGSFSVDVYAWEDIVDRLFELWPPIAEQHYPQIFGGEMRRLAKQLVACGTTLIQELVPSSKTDTFIPEMHAKQQAEGQDQPERVVRDKPTHFSNEQQDQSISHEAIRMVIDTLYTKQQEVAGLSCDKHGGTSDANPLATAIDRALQMKRDREASGRDSE